MEGRGVRCGTCDYLIKIDGKGADVWACACHDPECEHIREYRNADSVACKFHKCINKDYSKKAETEKVSDINNMGLRCGTCEYLKRYDGKGAKSVNVCECPDPECERIGEYRHFNNLACKFHKYINKDYSKKAETEKVSDTDIRFTKKARAHFGVYNDEARRNLAIAFLDAGYAVSYNDKYVSVYQIQI